MQRSSWAIGAFLLLSPPVAHAQAPAASSLESEPEGNQQAASTAESPPTDLSRDFKDTARPGVTAPVQESLYPAGSPVSEEVKATQREIGILVEDPMLGPVPPPEKILTDWRTALQYVRNRSTDYRRAHAQVEAARGQSRIALSSMLPFLTGSGNVNYRLINQNIRFGSNVVRNPRTTWSVGANLTVPVIAGRNWYEYATSRRQIAQRELEFEDAERLIIGGLAEAIVTVVTTERLAEVTRVNLAAALSNLELNRRRARLGSGNAVDVLRAEQEVANSRTQVVEGDESLRRAREALGQALGYPEAWGVTPEIRMDQLRNDARDTCERRDSIAERADVRAAAAGAAIAERNVDSVWFAFLPMVDFTSNLTHSSATSFQNDPQTIWTIGGQLTWHLYDGGRRYGERTLNQALLEQSRAALEQAERDAQVEVLQAVRSVDVAKQSLDVARESQRIASENTRLARSKFINGTGTSFDMVDTQRTARQTTIDVTVKEFELLRAEIIAFLALASCEI